MEHLQTQGISLPRLGPHLPLEGGARRAAVEGALGLGDRYIDTVESYR